MREHFRLPLSREDAIKALAIGVKSEVEFRQRTFEVSEDLRSQITVMATWLTSESSKFGLLLCGRCGNGKTTLVKAFQSLLNYLELQHERDSELWSICIKDAKDIVEIRKNNFEEWRRLCLRRMLAIDDLGTEPTRVLDYGNELNPVIDLLYKRYDEQLFTIVTTNLEPKEIREIYGDRIADRFNEMMEKIIFKNESYRNIK